MSDYTLVIPYAGKGREENDLYFYKLDEKGGKLAKKITGGEVFLKYSPVENQLIYLINKQKEL